MPSNLIPNYILKLPPYIQYIILVFLVLHIVLISGILLSYVSGWTKKSKLRPPFKAKLSWGVTWKFKFEKNERVLLHWRQNLHAIVYDRVYVDIDNFKRINIFYKYHFKWIFYSFSCRHVKRSSAQLAYQLKFMTWEYKGLTFPLLLWIGATRRFRQQEYLSK